MDHIATWANMLRAENVTQLRATSRIPDELTRARGGGWPVYNPMLCHTAEGRGKSLSPMGKSTKRKRRCTAGDRAAKQHLFPKEDPRSIRRHSGTTANWFGQADHATCRPVPRRTAEKGRASVGSWAFLVFSFSKQGRRLSSHDCCWQCWQMLANSGSQRAARGEAIGGITPGIE